ncbi:MAG: response regulator transcription factor [Phycisphaeraceae bacterium]|nr:response regulator transcription factor [Phycisphaeraceae bacterium]
MVSTNRQIICVVDDEVSMHKAVTRLLKGLDVHVIPFGSGKECLEYLSRRQCHLLIVDLNLSEVDGMELLKHAKDMAPWLSVMMVTGFGDVPLAVKALKLGASDFIEKPLERGVFLASVKGLLEKSKNMDERLGQSLTEAEMRILPLILAGQTSKKIANELFRSTRTVELHRQHLMRKMGVKNVVELVQRINGMGLSTMDH